MVTSRYAVVLALVCILVTLSSCSSRKPSVFDRWAHKDAERKLAVETEWLDLNEKSNPTSKDVARLHSLIEEQRGLYAKYHEEAPVELFVPKAFREKELDDLAMSGKVCVGMSRDQARRAWGPPRSINTTESASGISEQWCYANDYLYFDSGRLTSIQTSR